MTQITLDSLRRTFGDVVAVDRVDLVIADGAFVVLLGPSGCGKTTTLNMIAGLERTSGGRILFDGAEVQDVPPDERDIAMVFQSYALYPNRTVRQNIGFPLKMRRVNRQEIDRRVTSVAERLDIATLLDRHPRALSGGQQQRVALARAIVRQPRAFLLDEPLSNLDAKLRADMRFELKALQQELLGTFVHVTHDQAEAMSLADIVVVMQHGRIQQVGPPKTVYLEPLNKFVASFVGVPAMTMIDGEVREGAFEADGWRLPLPDHRFRGKATLGLRSEDVEIAPIKADGGNGGRVRLVELIGADALVDVEAPFGRIVARTPADVQLQPGDPVVVSAKSGRAHLFDAMTDQRIPVPASLPQV